MFLSFRSALLSGAAVAATVGSAGLGIGTAPVQASFIGLNIVEGTGITSSGNASLLSTDVVGVGAGSGFGWYNNFDLTSYGTYITPSSNALMSNLKDNTGTTTTVKLDINPTGTALDGTQTLGEAGYWNSGTAAGSLTPEQKLYNASIGAGGGRIAEFALTGITYAHYDIYVYLSYSQYQSASLQLFEGGTLAGAQNPYYFTKGLTWYPGNNLPTTYEQVTSTTSVSPTTTGNAGAYILFSGLSGSVQTLDFNPSANMNNGIAGFQIVSTAVPEPATLGLMGIAGLGILMLGKRRSSPNA